MMSGLLFPISPSAKSKGADRLPIPSEACVGIARSCKVLQEAMAVLLPVIPASNDPNVYIDALREKGGEDPKTLKTMHDVLENVENDFIALSHEIDKITNPTDKEIILPKWNSVCETYERISNYLANCLTHSDLDFYDRWVVALSKKCDDLASRIELSLGSSSPGARAIPGNRFLLWDQAIALATEVNRAVRGLFALRTSIMPGPDKVASFVACREHNMQSLHLNGLAHDLFKKVHGLVRQTLDKCAIDEASSKITDL